MKQIQMKNQDYTPEKYWTEVAKRIKKRDSGNNVIAGDDEPYYRYKRNRFLELLHEVHFEEQDVLEIGCGPGGNLLEIREHKPKRLVGVDISEEMVKLAKNKMPADIELIKIDGTSLPFADAEFDIVFTATVLQHNTDSVMLTQLISELSRVSNDNVYLFERIENEIKGDQSCLGRPVNYYSNIMNDNGFELVDTKFINIRTSYYVSGAIRKGMNSSHRKEGEPLNKISTIMQRISLPVTKKLDRIFLSKKDLCRMEYKRRK